MTSFDQNFSGELTAETDLQGGPNNRLLEDSFQTTKLPMADKPMAQTSGEQGNDRPADAKKPPDFEIIDDKDPELKRETAIKEIARQIKNGTLNEPTKKFLLEALNAGETGEARRKSFNDAITKINQELMKVYRQDGERDLSKQFEIRYLNIKGADGSYDKLRIGLQSRSGKDYHDSFLVRIKK